LNYGLARVAGARGHNLTQHQSWVTQPGQRGNGIGGGATLHQRNHPDS
jgi:hypothetical protein